MMISITRTAYTLKSILQINKEKGHYLLGLVYCVIIVSCMKSLLLVFVLVSFFSAGGVAQKKIRNKHSAKVTKTPKKKIIIKYGTASYYAKKFDERRTANGGIYRSSEYSAACNVLPLNTWVKITNLKNERSVIVKIIDRLHARNKRLIDLSRIAARELGYLSRGLTKVKLEVLNNFHLSKK